MHVDGGVSDFYLTKHAHLIFYTRNDPDKVVAKSLEYDPETNTAQEPTGAPKSTSIALTICLLRG